MDGFIICIISIGNLIQKLQNEPDIVAGSIIRKGIGCDGRVYVESMDGRKSPSRKCCMAG